MEKDYKNIDFNSLKRYYLLQRCVKVDEDYDYEYSDEFYVTAPVEVNDLYNQN